MDNLKIKVQEALVRQDKRLTKVYSGVGYLIKTAAVGTVGGLFVYCATKGRIQEVAGWVSFFSFVSLFPILQTAEMVDKHHQWIKDRLFEIRIKKYVPNEPVVDTVDVAAKLGRQYGEDNLLDDFKEE